MYSQIGKSIQRLSDGLLGPSGWVCHSLNPWHIRFVLPVISAPGSHFKLALDLLLKTRSVLMHLFCCQKLKMDFSGSISISMIALSGFAPRFQVSELHGAKKVFAPAYSYSYCQLPAVV